MNKKGLDAKVLVELLLVIAGMVVLFLVYTYFSSGIKSGTDSDICRSSVLTSTILKYPGLGNPLIDLKCKTKSKVIEGSKDKVVEEITKDVYDCSYQYYDGKLDFVSSWKKNWESAIFKELFSGESDAQCFICYIDNSKEDISFNVEDLKKFKKQEIKLIVDADKLMVGKQKQIFVGFAIKKAIFNHGDTRFSASAKDYLYNVLPTLSVFVPYIGVFKNGEHFSTTFVFDDDTLKKVCGDNINVFTK